MLGLDIALSFFGIAVLLALAPGPDNLFVLAQSAASGRAAGFYVILGLCTGIVGHTVAVTLGLAAVFKASPLAFTALQLAGALYLLYLAVLSFKAAAPSSRQGQAKQPALSAMQLYRRGIIMNLTNPKVSLFFLAFLPQFTQAEKGYVGLQMFSLGILFMLATLLIFGLIAFFSGWVGQFLRRQPTMQAVLDRLAGVIFAGIAIKLIKDLSLR